MIANNNGNTYTVGPTTAISTDPFITTQGVTDSGRIYRGGTPGSPATANSVDGLPSAYFLGAASGPTSFDTQVGFDSQFGTLGNVGGFKFNNLGLVGNPASISTAGGPTSLVFVTTGNIGDSAPYTNVYSSTFDLRGLDNVAFVTQNGGITLANGLTFTNSGATATALTLYARGGSLYNDNGAFNLPGSAVNLYSDTSVISYGSIGSANAAGAGAVNYISGGALTIGGVVNASGTITATTTADGAGDLSLITSNQIVSGGDFDANSGGALTAQGTINTTGDTRLFAAGAVSLVGNVTTGGNLRLRSDAGDVTTDANNVASVAGVFSAVATTGNLTLNGTVGSDGNNPNATTPASAVLIAGLTLTLNGDLSAATSVAITSTGGGVTQSAGTVQATGVDSQGNATAGTLTLTTTNGDISLTGGTLQGNTVSVTSGNGNVTQGSGHTLMTNTGDVTITSNGGTVTLGGTVDSGNGIQASAGGALLLQGATLYAGDSANVSLVSSGDNVTVDADTSVFMNGGVFSANASQTLTIDGRIGENFGEGGEGGERPPAATRPRLVQPGDEGIFGPDYATGVAGNGITINGSVFTIGAGGGPNGTDGINFTANGGDFTVGQGAQLGANGGGITLTAKQGAMTINGEVGTGGFGDFMDITLTSSGDMALDGAIFSSGNLQASSNGGMLTVGEGANANGDSGVTLFSAGDMVISGTVYSSGGNLSLTSNNNLTVTTDGVAYTSSTGHSFALTSYSGAITVNGDVEADYSAPGTISTLSATDVHNGAIAINGSVNVGRDELDINAGTTFANDPTNSSITGTIFNITAGTTATVQLSRFHYGGDEDAAMMNVTAATIVASTDAEGSEGISPLNLTATGPITLTGNIGVHTLSGGNLTVSPDSAVEFDSLNTTGPTGAVVIGDGSFFRVEENMGHNNVGPITLDGSPTVQIGSSLAVAGGISTTSADQSPALSLDPNATLNATGSIALGAGSLGGGFSSIVTTNSTLTTTGSVSVSALNAHGGFTVGALSADAITLQDLGGNVAANRPPSIVNGPVTAYRSDNDGLNTFTLGQFTAGALDFAGSNELNENTDGVSLTLNLKANFGVGAGGVAGFVTSGDFSSGQFAADSTTYDGTAAGPGGVFTVTTTPNPAVGAGGSIRVQDNGTGTIPVINANGGAFAPTEDNISGTGGAGGQILFTAASGISIGNANTPATLSATGGQYAVAGGQTTYTGGGSPDGGAGGTIILTATNDLTLTGTASAGLTTLSARGGSVVNSETGSGGRGGTIDLVAGGVVTLLNAQADVRGGDISGAAAPGDAAGGTINVTSNNTASATATTVAITNSLLLAANGQTGDGTSSGQLAGSGGTINVTSFDGSDATAGTGTSAATASASPSPAPVPAIRISGSTLAASTEQTAETPAPYGSLNGGTINVTSSRLGGPGISVQGASQLLAVVDNNSQGTGGHVALTTSGADIAITGNSTVRASGPNSGVTISTGGGTAGAISINASTVNTASTYGYLTPGGVVALTAGTALSVANGSSLSADTLNLTSAGAVTVDNGSSTAYTTLYANTLTVQATGASGTVAAVNTGPSGANPTTLDATGTLSLLAPGGAGAITIGPTLNTNSVALYADVLKIYANGANGSIVINGGSTLNASMQLKLYASGSSGAITFEGGNITLNTGTVAGILAANSITINTGTTVTVTGSHPLTVFTNNPDYATASGGNGSQGGTFAGAAQPTGTPAPLAQAPVASALKGGRPVAARADGTRVVAAGPGYTLVATRVPGSERPALPPGFTRRGPAVGTGVRPGVPAADLRKRPAPVDAGWRRPGAANVAR